MSLWESIVKTCIEEACTSGSLPNGNALLGRIGIHAAEFVVLYQFGISVNEVGARVPRSRIIELRR